MQRITELQDIGVGKKCLIIGGGRSVLSFDFNKLNVDTVIGCNESGYMAREGFGVKVDYSIYNDLGAVHEVSKFPKVDGMKLICSNTNLDKRADYDYRLKELKYAVDSDNIGKKALIIAHDFMNFNEIYLIGYDFQTEIMDGKEVSHFFGDSVGKGMKYCEKQKLEDHFKRLNDMVEQFDNISHYKNVYNLNKDSKLKCYSYKSIE